MFIKLKAFDPMDRNGRRRNGGLRPQRDVVLNILQITSVVWLAASAKVTTITGEVFNVTEKASRDHLHELIEAAEGMLNVHEANG